MTEDILAARHVATLADFASSNVLVGFDYDGTLAPIASRPERARMRPETHRLLSRLARRYPCVVISGRSDEELVGRLGRLPLWHVFGNHGLEPWAYDPAGAARIRDWVSQLRALESHRGIIVEDKTYSVAVHYRHCRDKSGALRKIRAAVRNLEGARVLGGRLAVNLTLREAPTKGSALQRAQQVLACDTAIYVGDDETDEDALTSAPAGQLLGIHVGPSRVSRARYHLKSQTDIDRLLSCLITLRARRSAPVAGRRRA